jgi:hypothetical protein
VIYVSGKELMIYDKYVLFTITDWDDFWVGIRLWRKGYKWPEILEWFRGME